MWVFFKPQLKKSSINSNPQKLGLFWVDIPHNQWSADDLYSPFSNSIPDGTKPKQFGLCATTAAVNLTGIRFCQTKLM